MSEQFSSIGIVGKPGDSRVKSTVTALAKHLAARSIEVRVDPRTHALLESGGCQSCETDELRERCDLLIVVGGDGTLLGAARTLAAGGPPLLGINLGRLGFLVDVSPDNMLETLDRTLAGEYEQESRFLLQARIGETPEQAEPSAALSGAASRPSATPCNAG